MCRKNQIYVTLCVLIVLSILVLYQGSEAAQTWGLCIGISEYEPKEISLKWANKDAIQFSTFLKYGLNLPESHYRILQDSEATRDNIFNALAWLSIVAEEGDRVYIFYSGHSKGNSPILPYDSDNPLSPEILKRSLEKIEGKIIFFINGAGSGRFAEITERTVVDLRNLTGLTKDFVVNMARAKTGAVIMASANETQFSIELQDQKNGLFTYYLMETLMNKKQRADADGDGNLTLYEVYQDVYKAMIDQIMITKDSLNQLQIKGIPNDVLGDLQLHFLDVQFKNHQAFRENIQVAIDTKNFDQYQSLIEEHAEKSGQQPQISDIEKAKQIVVLSYPKPTPTPTPGPATPAIPIQMVSPFPPEQTWALCIGISEYAPSYLLLKWADKDAIEFSIFVKDHLKLPEEHYRIRKNREATQNNIIDDFGWLIAQAGEKDRVYIFYSGHGMQDAPIVPYNSEKLLFLEKFKRLLQKIDAQDIIIFTDACYSGRLAQSGIKAALSKSLVGMSKGVADDIAQVQKGTVIVTSADGIQLSVEREDQKNGLFTHYLMDTLKNRHREADIDRDGKLTLYEVYQDVHKTVTDQTLRFKITERSLENLKKARMPDDVLKKFGSLGLKNEEFVSSRKLLHLLQESLTLRKYTQLILEHAEKSGQEPQISGEEKAKQIVLFSSTSPLISPHILNVDDLDAIESLSMSLQLKSPLQITWNSKKKWQVQIIGKNGQCIYDKMHASGEAVIDIEPGLIEIKFWEPGSATPYKSVWVEIID